MVSTLDQLHYLLKKRIHGIVIGYHLKNEEELLEGKMLVFPFLLAGAHGHRVHMGPCACDHNALIRPCPEPELSRLPRPADCGDGWTWCLRTGGRRPLPSWTIPLILFTTRKQWDHRS